MQKDSAEPGSGDRAGVAVEDFLRAIHVLANGAEPVSTSALAARLKISDSAVTKMARRLHERGLVRHLPYHGVLLSDEGSRIAVEKVRHHRLLELFLVKHLGYDWSTVHDEADRLEHAVSAEFLARIDRLLGYPSADPHGDPIPSASGRVPSDHLIELGGLQAKRKATVGRILAQQDQELRYLAEVGIVPGASIEVTDVAPLGGPITVVLPGRSVALSREMAMRILVAEDRESD